MGARRYQAPPWSCSRGADTTPFPAQHQLWRSDPSQSLPARPRGNADPRLNDSPHTRPLYASEVTPEGAEVPMVKDAVGGGGTRV